MKKSGQIGVLMAVVTTLSGQASAQTCNPYIPLANPDSQYKANGDGTASDFSTGLMWKQCGEGQTGDGCSGVLAYYTWQGALQQVAYVNSHGGFAGYTDWRLPDIKELQSIVDEACYGPAINLTVFPNTYATSYLSSSPYRGSGFANGVWSVSFYDGDESKSPRDYTLPVRLVRGGE